MEKATASGAADPVSPPAPAPTPPLLAPEEARRLSVLREACLRSLAQRYCVVFLVVALPAFVLTAASEGEAIPVVVPAFVVLTGLLAALVSEKSQPGRKLRELDLFLKGSAPAPRFDPLAETAPERAGRPAVPPRLDAESEPPPAPPFLLRAFYFLVIGAWLSCIWVHLAWVLSLFVVGIGAGRAMFEQLPVVMSLSPVRTPPAPPPMRARVPFPIAAIYFVGVGSWLSLLLTEIGWLLSILPLPRRVGLSCLRAVPYVLTLRSK